MTRRQAAQRCYCEDHDAAASAGATEQLARFRRAREDERARYFEVGRACPPTRAALEVARLCRGRSGGPVVHPGRGRRPGAPRRPARRPRPGRAIQPLSAVRRSRRSRACASPRARARRHRLAAGPGRGRRQRRVQVAAAALAAGDRPRAERHIEPGRWPRPPTPGAPHRPPACTSWSAAARAPPPTSATARPPKALASLLLESGETDAALEAPQPAHRSPAAPPRPDGAAGRRAAHPR
ncbi:MAG: hypothetical protein R3F43_21990 [bacterium]